MFRKFLISAAAGAALVAASSLAFTSAAQAAAAAPTATVRATVVRHQEWPAVTPASDIAPGASIGTAWPPLKGGTVYSEALSYTEDWYALYKQRDTAIATITVTNTSSGSLNCTGVLVQVLGADGTSDQIAAAYLNANQADTFTVPGTEAGDPQGRYYLEITPNCQNGLPDGQTYTVEPEPAAQWGNGGRTLPFGPGKTAAAGPLAGGVNYTATVASKSVQDWSYFTAKGAANVRVQDTSASAARCDLAISAGGSSVTLHAGQVASLHVARAGTYYLELAAAAGCAPRSALGALLELTGSIHGPVLTVTDPTLRAGMVKKAYAATISVTGGKKPYVFAALTPLPPGLRLNKTSGAITGKPTKAGTYKVMITVGDSAKPMHDIITTPVTIAII